MLELPLLPFFFDALSFVPAGAYARIERCTTVGGGEDADAWPAGVAGITGNPTSVRCVGEDVNSRRRDVMRDEGAD